MKIATETKSAKLVESERDSLKAQLADAAAKIQVLNSKLQAATRALDAAEVEKASLQDRIAVLNPLLKVAPSGPVVAPRSYCDYCEAFDKHDTLDCPQNPTARAVISFKPASSGAESERPYCSICESFGHVDSECNDELVSHTSTGIVTDPSPSGVLAACDSAGE